VWRQKRGKDTEERFFRALKKRTLVTPEWFIKVRKASPDMDQKGVDAIVRIDVPTRKRHVSIPIQIKTSWHGLRRYWIKRPSALYRGAVLVIVVPPHFSDDQIRERTYMLLDKIRRGGRRFNDFFITITAPKAK
jgi:hypothetical protein